MPTSYQPLADYLAAQPPETTEITLTIAAVEAVVGAPLPASAWARAWWSNKPYGRWEVRPWVAAGWRVAGTAMRSAPPTVTFVRVRSDSSG
jgi:hypothetical protein